MKDRIVTINVCIGVLCKHKVMGCSVNGVKSDCWRCRTKSTCDMVTHTAEYNYDFCSRCLDKEMENFLEAGVPV